MVLDILVKATFVLGVAALFSVVSRGRATAAVRHAVWVAAMIGAVLVPALSAALPALRVPLLPAEFRPVAVASKPTTPSAPTTPQALPATTPEASGDDIAGTAMLTARDVPTVSAHHEAAAQPNAVAGVADDTRRLLRVLRDSVNGMPMLAVLWGLGALLLLTRVVVSRIQAARVTRMRVPGRAPWLPAARRLARIMRVPRRLRFLRSDRVSMPMACGVLRPAVVMPTDADAWTADRLESVLLHELGHVRRRDCLTQVAADVALALLWFHPLAWVARRAIRRERERACDDLVLAAGTPAPEYASHLLDVARDARQRSDSLALAGGVAMARPSELEGRLMAILDDSRPRRALTLRACATVGLITLGVVAPMSALDLWQAPGVDTRAVPASPTERPRPARRQPTTLPIAASAPTAPALADATGQEPMPMPAPEPAPAVAHTAVVAPTPMPAPIAITTPADASAALEFDFDFDVMKHAAPAMAMAMAMVQSPAAPKVPAVAAVDIKPGAPAKGNTRTPPDPRVVAALTDALKDSDAEVRRQALHTLSRFRDPSVVDALISVLSHTDADMRRQAAHALSNNRDPRAQKALAGLLNDQDVQVRRQALFSLARQKDPAAFEPLVAALKDTDPDIRRQAAQALGQLRDVRAVPALTTAVSDGTADVRQQAVFALGQLRSAEAIAPLQTALKDTDPEVREQAAFALGQIRDIRAVEALMSAAKDSNTSVRKQAYFALGQVGDARAQELAIAGLKDTDPEVRRMAAFALARIADRNE
ncbi:MAG TPA: M56 family metallopeptidase [Luteitalea sp.]|nr:M56 family metallopeptidase [Luteitalea sp.]